MDNIKTPPRKVNPKQNANIIFALFFSYTFKLFKQGFRGDIRNGDIYEVLPEYKSEKLGARLEKEWLKKKYRKKPSIYALLWNTFGWHYVLLNITQIINVAISSVANPLLIGILVSYFVPGQKRITKTSAILYGCLLIFLNFVRAIYTQNFRLVMVGFGLKLKAALGSFIYKRVLNMKSSQLNKTQIGRYTTLISNDLTDIATSVQFMIFIWGDILKVIMVIFVMHRKIGFYAAILTVTLTVALLVFVYVVKKIFVFFRTRSAKTDERITITKRILTYIRTIKMCTWEQYFHQNVSASRRDEINASSAIFGLYAVNKCLGTFFYQFCFYFILITYVEFGEGVAAKDIYFVISSLQSIAICVINTIPGALFHLNYILNALQRIKVVFENYTLQQHAQEKSKHLGQSRLVLDNVSLSIRENEILRDINLNFERGLNVLTGPVGGGKSMLLKLILGDLVPSEGNIICKGSFSYASQEPWLFPSTVRQNIVFTEKFNEERYYQVVRSCGLLHDFMSWEKRDQNIVAEHGINLSKGQQTRINLARAVYRDADIYLIDDCFSVLDNIVADFVFKECILNLLKDKIVVLVSHNDKCISFGCNEIKLDKRHLSCAIKNPCKITVENIENVCSKDTDSMLEDEDNATEQDSLLNIVQKEKKIYDEDKKSKAVSFNTYYKYLEFGGGWFAFFIVLTTFTINQVISSYKDKLLSTWSNLEQRMINYTSHNGTKEDAVYLEMYNKRIHIIYLYAGIVLSIMLAMSLQTLSMFVFSRKVSLKFHKFLMTKMIGAQMSFYSNNFLGNVLNRLYQDMLILDKTIPVDLIIMLIVFFEFVGSIVLVISVNYMFLIPTACLFVVLYILRFCYLRTAVNLKRLACSSKSAMIGYMTSTLDGLTTIQVSNGEKILQTEFDHHQDLATSANYMYECCRHAFTFAGDFCCGLFIAFVILRFLLGENDASVGGVGLAITQSFVMSFRVYLGISQWANFDTLMTSVERLLEYTKMKQEPEDGLIIENWPKMGEIKFENVSLSYSNSQIYALKKLNFVINAGERVGIVGRTGSGKSSIISVLFRLYEVEGRILIDNTDIKTLSLDILRHQMAVIPQDPFVFPGTIRENIDPLRNYPDEKIYKAMETSKLSQFIPSIEFKIKHESDLSLGQKQLICLARVLVRDTKIVVFDEAAENVDQELGLLMKNIINDNINNCTIITVAHKLDFVMDCDKIILIHDGEVRELGAPNILLKNKNGRFYKMYERPL